jgi:UDP-4-amino-4,6-dideoxy-N-acetyl-beta-L-altrosamine N-acetyltransferase
MRIVGYGVELKRLTVNDIETVRHHRNSEKINQYMEYRDYISFEQQLNWFNSINNSNNNYFIIEHKGKEVGLIYGAEINWENKTTGNGGIFIWDINYWETATPTASSFLLTDTSILLGLKKTYIKVLSSNHRAIEFNKSLCYRLLPSQEGVINQQYELDIEDYKKLRLSLRQRLFHEKDYKNLTIHFDKENEIDLFYLHLIENQPTENTIDFTITF